MARPWFLLLTLAFPGQASGAFLDMGSGARPVAMAGAFVAVADDVHSVFYNPAGLGVLARPQMLASHALLHNGLDDGSGLGLSDIAFAYPLRNGKRGSVGAYWKRLGLDDLYAESHLALSYGRRLSEKGLGGGWFGGATVKRLSRSFGGAPEASNALNLLTATGQADPLLGQVDGQSAFEADLGFLFRFRNRYSVGFAAQNLMGSDWAVGSGGEDPIARSYRLGFSNKSLWMTLSGELKLEDGAGDETDKDFSIAAERIFPTLDKGQFGLRGGVLIGSRERREITTGLSYRINKIQFDYAFLFPVGGISATAGTHRVGLVFHFGAPTQEERYADKILDQIARLNPEGAKDEFESLRNPNRLEGETYEEVRELIKRRLFREAYRRLTELSGEAADESLLRVTQRVGIVAGFYPTLENIEEKWEKSLDRSIERFIRGEDRLSLLHASYAVSLNPQQETLNRFLARLEQATGLPAERVEADSGLSLIDVKFAEGEKLHLKGRHRAALSVVKDVIELEADSVRALSRMGSAHYALGNFEKAVRFWEKALPKEEDPLERASLVRYIKNTRSKLRSSGAVLPPAPKELQQSVPAPEERRAPVDARTVERLYQIGVEAYAKGQRLKAKATFRRILSLDPDNVQARKALDRIERRGAVR